MTQKTRSYSYSITMKRGGTLVLLGLIWLISNNLVYAGDSSQDKSLKTTETGALTDETSQANRQSKLSKYVIERFGTPPPVLDGPLNEEVTQALNTA